MGRKAQRNQPTNAKSLLTFLVILFISMALTGGGIYLILARHEPLGLEFMAPIFGYWLPHPKAEPIWRRFIGQIVITIILVLLSLYIFFVGDYAPVIQHGIYSLTLLVIGYWLE